MNNSIWWKGYKLYLQSEHWKRVRKYVMTRDSKLCQLCLLNNADSVHHLSYDTYNSIGKTLPIECCAICATCHAEIHCDDEILKWSNKHLVNHSTKCNNITIKQQVLPEYCIFNRHNLIITICNGLQGCADFTNDRLKDIDSYINGTRKTLFGNIDIKLKTKVNADRLEEYLTRQKHITLDKHSFDCESLCGFNILTPKKIINASFSFKNIGTIFPIYLTEIFGHTTKPLSSNAIKKFIEEREKYQLYPSYCDEEIITRYLNKLWNSGYLGKVKFNNKVSFYHTEEFKPLHTLIN